MKHIPINVHQDAQEYPGPFTVGEVLELSKHLKLAGEAQRHYLLEHPDQAPDFLKEKIKGANVNALLFGGTINVDENKKKYINAVYFTKYKGLVTEKYWLADPMLPNARFAVLH